MLCVRWEEFLINNLFFIFIGMQGIIKVLKNGFGFIKSDETPNDVFFHSNNLEWVEFDSLEEWNTVSFEIGDGKNWKKQWVNVQLVETEGEEA